MSEYTEVTDKLSELRQQKQKLSRQVTVCEGGGKGLSTHFIYLSSDLKMPRKGGIQLMTSQIFQFLSCECLLKQIVMILSVDDLDDDF